MRVTRGEGQRREGRDGSEKGGESQRRSESKKGRVREGEGRVRELEKGRRRRVRHTMG